MAAKSAVWTSGETGAGALAFCYTRNAKGLREPEEGVLDAVRIVLVSDKLQAFYVRGSHVGGVSPRKSNARGCSFVLWRLSWNGFCIFIFFPYIRVMYQYVHPTINTTLWLPSAVGTSTYSYRSITRGSEVVALVAVKAVQHSLRSAVCVAGVVLVVCYVWVDIIAATVTLFSCSRTKQAAVAQVVAA